MEREKKGERGKEGRVTGSKKNGKGWWGERERK
jgi:hypothetical protein